MRKQLVKRPQSSLWSQPASEANRQVEKFFAWEKHPRQKTQDLKRSITPILFF